MHTRAESAQKRVIQDLQSYFDANVHAARGKNVKVSVAIERYRYVRFESHHLLGAGRGTPHVWVDSCSQQMLRCSANVAEFLTRA